MDERALWSATDQASAIRARELSSRELLAMELDRVERLNPSLNAVVTLDVESALVAAADADERTMRGEPTGPLHGLPVTIKDAIETAGMRSTGGATELAHHVPTTDAPVVARLRAAGAVVYGKTNVPRWSGDIQTFNELFGTTNNPWDPTRTPGGSSGGPAAAVATGMTAFEVGTDIGGSIRIPSHFCGVCGHKPSWGIVSQRGYLDHVGGGRTDADINVFGPIARAVGDLELLLGVLAGPDAEVAPAWQLGLPAPRGPELSQLRIGTWLDDPAAAVDGEVVAVLEAAAGALTDAGARVDTSRPALDLREVAALFQELVLAAISPSLPPDFADAASGSHRHWLELDARRSRVRGVWADWFADHDVLLCPVMPAAAFAHDQHGTLTDRTLTINGASRPHADLLVWTGLIGVAYLPSTVVPVGRTTAGLPVGVQVVGPYLEDRTCLWVAAALERLCGGYAPPPLAVHPGPA